MGILFTQFHCVTNLSELFWTRLCRMRVFSLQNLFSYNYNELNHRSLSCSQVISIAISVWKLKCGRIWQKLQCLVQEPNGMLVWWWRFWWEIKDKTPCTATVFTKWAYNIDFFLFKRMLSDKICFEFWARQQRLWFDYLQLLIPQGGDFSEIERAFFVN